jgi:hypothetical protein
VCRTVPAIVFPSHAQQQVNICQLCVFAHAVLHGKMLHVVFFGLKAVMCKKLARLRKEAHAQKPLA